MNKREYLRSLGFTVGERGRFTPEMLTALKNAEIDFEGNTPKPQDVVGIEVLEYVGPTSTKMREPRSLYGFTSEGHKIGFSLCFSCSQHMMYCECKRGVTAPSIVAYTKEPDVYIPDHQRSDKHSQQPV